MVKYFKCVENKRRPTNRQNMLVENFTENPIVIARLDIDLLKRSRVRLKLLVGMKSVLILIGLGINKAACAMRVGLSLVIFQILR